jgi:parvulin-like peptidyl-prolyl isomerase
MSNPTLHSPKRPSSQRPAQQRRRTKSAARTATVFRKQTARLEGRRDGTPLIFGWGRHLTRAQKTRLQQNAAYIFFGAVTVAVIGVFLFGLLQQTVLIPNATIVKINAVSVAQDTYRKLLAYDAQDLWNQMQAGIKKHDELGERQAKGDNSVANDLAVVTSQVEVQEGNYAQATLTQSTIDQITEDQLIQQGAVRFEQQDKTAQGKLTPKSADIDKQWVAFKNAFPANEKYSDFLSKNGLSDDDVKSAIALHMRRDLMQEYLASQLTSPARQVHLRHIVASTKDAAQTALAELQKNKLLASTNTNWSDVAKKDSVDIDTKDKGGDMGWIPQGHGDAGVELWAYDPARKVGDWQLIATASGTFDVVQILGIDPSRPTDATTLKNSQDNALAHWLGGQRVAPFNHISTPDADMLQATRNLPQLPDLKAQLPNYNPNQSPGAPGPIPGFPGG